MSSVVDIYKQCPLDVMSDTLCPVTAYFWSHLVARHLPISELRDTMMKQVHECRTPRLYVARVSDAVDVFVVRGTSTKRDVHVDVSFRMSDTKLRKRIQHVTASATEGMRREVVRTTDLAISQRWHLHRGMFVRAAGVAAAISNLASPERAVRLYGHSLGGACVSMVFAWLRGANISGEIKAAVMSSPDFCDANCRNAWLAHHDDPGYFRHYYTRGDPFVHRIPRLAGFRNGLSASPFICPMPLLDKHNLVISSIRPLLAHVIYSAQKFAKTSTRSRHGTMQTLAVCCNTIEILAAPKYMHALRRHNP